MAIGTPEGIVDALVARGARGLTVIGNDTARPGLGARAARELDRAGQDRAGEGPRDGPGFRRAARGTRARRQRAGRAGRDHRGADRPGRGAGSVVVGQTSTTMRLSSTLTGIVVAASSSAVSSAAPTAPAG
ncbi:hypothetical protein [Falsiroseomonas sp. HW251]|uniref:hypothetical protein n=1 Tax=Falsiroseomonas sp. HW251 TaxID=3390998 RepID=UPI003D3208F1